MTTPVSAPPDAPRSHSEVRVLVVESNIALRAAILAVLEAHNIEAEASASLEHVLVHTDATKPTVGLVAWQAMDGLLAEEHRPHLVDVTRRLRLVLMVPRRWMRLLERTDLGVSVAGIISKPIEPDELIEVIERAAVTPLVT